MKKFIIAMVALMGTMFTSANAMSYEQARDQALFLTDKMAYELNLDEEQYEAAYEINLDYLMGVNTYDDVYAEYWVRRNADLRIVLLDWQYTAFCAATYFYRPIWWEGGYWHFGIYARYPHRDYFFFGCPHFYHTYRGGHAWHHNGGRSWYHGRTFVSHSTHNHGNFSGMRDGWNRGDYRSNSRSNGRVGSGSSRSMEGHRSVGSESSRRSGIYGSGTSRGNASSGVQHERGGSSSGNFSGRRVVGGQSNGASERSTGSSYGRDNVSGTRQSSTRTTVTRPSGSSSSSPSSSSSSSFSGRRVSPSSSSSSPARSSGAFSGNGSSTRSSSSFSGSGSSFSRGGGGSFSHGGGASHGGGGSHVGFSGRR